MIDKRLQVGDALLTARTSKHLLYEIMVQEPISLEEAKGIILAGKIERINPNKEIPNQNFYVLDTGYEINTRVGSFDLLPNENNIVFTIGE